MTRRVLILLALLIPIGVYAAQSHKLEPLYKTMRLNFADVAISCKDGHTPSSRVLEGSSIVVVSCPLSRSEN